jgi:hypothetical protein
MINSIKEKPGLFLHGFILFFLLPGPEACPSRERAEKEKKGEVRGKEGETVTRDTNG